MKILVVDDEAISLESMDDTLTMLGHEPVLCDRADKALALCAETFFPVIISDVRMPGMDGLSFLRTIKELEHTRDSDVIMITGHSDVDMAITALRQGAYDFLRKPLDARELTAAIERSAEHQSLRMENEELTHHCDQRVQSATQEMRNDLQRARDMLRKVSGIGDVVTASEAMVKVLGDTRLYHENPDVPVLIEGETGTGKEVVARLIHHGEEVVSSPFVDINCSVISESLFESELFGYEAGAFTGGNRKGAKGKLEAAEDGTLFLDEIGELPLPFQPKLLRVLQERNFFRVGGVKKRQFRARIVCATNQNLEAMVERGEFRRDLYHRLKIGYLGLPPLRERPEDILGLAELFLRKESLARGKRFEALSPGALDLLQSFPWPGNVREMKNAIERAVLIHDGTMLLPEHFEFLRDGNGNMARSAPRLSLGTIDELELPEAGFDLDGFVADLKQEIVRKAVEKFEGNKSQAAQYLNWDRNKIYRTMGN